MLQTLTEPQQARQRLAMAWSAVPRAAAVAQRLRCQTCRLQTCHDYRRRSLSAAPVQSAIGAAST